MKMELEPQNLTIEQLAKILKALPALKSWMISIEEYALNLLEQGQEVPGFELGITRPSRVWIDESLVISTLEKAKIDQDKYMPRSLLSVAQMEKLLGKKEFASLLMQEVGSTTGNPKLQEKA